MSISFKGFNEQVITFRTESELEAGTLVKVSGSATVAAATSGEDFIGIVVCTHGDIAAVQVGGYVSLPYSGSAPTLGTASIAPADSKTVTASDSGKTVTVVELDTENSTAGILL